MFTDILNKLKDAVVKGAKNWITTITGAGVGIGIVWEYITAAMDNDPTNDVSFSLLLTGIAAFLFGLFAKDGNKSTEDVMSAAEKEAKIAGGVDISTKK